MTYRLLIESLLGCAILGATACLFFTASEKTLPKLEKLTRNRYVGLLFGYPALFICVPYAQIVSPGFLLPFLWPLAVVLPILCYFFVDYLGARGFAGMVIIFAYDLIHGSFDARMPGAGAIAIVSWIMGGAGIWVSGIPCSLRDAFRLAAKKKLWRIVFGTAAVIFALTAAYTAVMCLK